MKNTKKLLSFSLSILLLFSFISIIPLNVNAETGNKDKVMKYLKTDKYEIWLIDKNANNKIKDGSKPPVLENTEDDYVETVGYLGDKNASTINDIIKSYNYTYPEDNITRTIPTKSIGHDTFRDCKNLQKVEFPSTLDKIGYGAFHGCTALKEITIPNTVTAIGNFAFSNCSSLSKITFDTGLKAIGKFAFAECNSLKSVTIPNTVTFIDDSAFTQCANLETFNMGNGVTEVGDLVLFANPKLKNLTISNKLSTVAYMMCKECTSLTSVTIPEGVKKLDFAAFKDCTNLTTVSLPATLKEIDYCVFEGCKVSSITYNGSVDNYKRIAKGKENGSFETATVNGQSNSKKTAKLTGAMKGDADADGNFDIKDVTYTQKFIAEINEDIADEADYNEDGKINVSDGTEMQKALAKIN